MTNFVRIQAGTQTICSGRKYRRAATQDNQKRRVLTAHLREHFLKLCLSLWRFAGMLRITALHSVHDMTLRMTGVNVELV